MHLTKAIVDLTEKNNDNMDLIQTIADFKAYDSLTNDELLYCQNKLISYLTNSDGFGKTPNNYIFSASLLANKFSAREGIFYLNKIFFLFSEAAIRHQIFWNMASLNFRMNAKCKALICSTFFELTTSWRFDIPEFTYTGQFDCVILTSQLLTRKHGPTEIAFSYFKILKNLGFNPLIVNTDELPKTCALPFYHKFIANPSKYPPGLIAINIDGEKVFIFSPKIDMPNSIGFGVISALISKIQPKFILGCGQYFMLQEALGAKYNFILMPLSLELAPSRSCKSVLFRKMDEEDKLFIKEFSINETLIFDDQPCNFDLSPLKSIHYSRAQFDISDEDFLICIVGNRLESDLVNEFLECLKAIVRPNPKVKVLFVGYLSVELREFLALSFAAEAVRFLDYSPDLVGLFNLCDLYLNPPRQGGGSAAAYALAANLPVYSLNYGDVSYFLPESFLMQDFSNMAGAIERLLVSNDRQIEKDLAHDTYLRVSNRAAVVKDVLQLAGVEIPVRQAN